MFILTSYILLGFAPELSHLELALRRPVNHARYFSKTSRMHFRVC